MRDVQRWGVMTHRHRAAQRPLQQPDEAGGVAAGPRRGARARAPIAVAGEGAGRPRRSRATGRPCDQPGTAMPADRPARREDAQGGAGDAARAARDCGASAAGRAPGGMLNMLSGEAVPLSMVPGSCPFQRCEAS